jgi:hypothetical protein
VYQGSRVRLHQAVGARPHRLQRDPHAPGGQRGGAAGAEGHRGHGDRAAHAGRHAARQRIHVDGGAVWQQESGSAEGHRGHGDRAAHAGRHAARQRIHVHGGAVWQQESGSAGRNLMGRLSGVVWSGVEQ